MNVNHWRTWAQAVLVGLSLTGYACAAENGAAEATCASCHGKDGASTEADVPIIGGIPASNIQFNLTAYKNKERPCPQVKVKNGPDAGKQTDMCEVSKALSDADIAQLSKSFAAKKFVRARQEFDAELAAQGKLIHQQQCEKCHANDGSDAKDEASILAGQWKGYLRDAFKEFSEGTRPMEQKMKPRIKKVDQNGFEALVNYYASFK
jgi:sulfide dehydrogenase cytochrome subunit